MFDYKRKQHNITTQVNYMFSRSLNMFIYTGLPDSLPQIELEKILQRTGHGFITQVENELYVFRGAFAGEQDVYGNDTQYIVTNPALKLNETYDLKTDGVLIKNDDLMMGLTPIYERFITMLVENEISMVMDSYNKRIQTLISASDDNTKASAELFLKKIVDGDLGIIGENPIFDGVKTHSTQSTTTGSITQMVEYHQYLKASLYNEIGLNANFNMKRERLSSGETNLNIEALYPLIDDMLQCRKEALSLINEQYGLNVSVEFNGVWTLRERPQEDNTVLDEPTDEPLDESIDEPLDEPVDEPTDEPVDEPLDEPTDEPIEVEVELMDESVEELVEVLDELVEDIKEVMEVD